MLTHSRDSHREVLSNLLTEDQLLDDPSFSFSPLGFPSNGDSPSSIMSESKQACTHNDPLSVALNVPTAFGIKTLQDKVTYINKGERREREREREREYKRHVSIDQPTLSICLHGCYILL